MEKNETCARMSFAEREQTANMIRQISASTELAVKVGSYPFWTPKSVRFQIALLLCLSIMCLGMMRSGLSMAMVCMVNSTALAYMGDDSSQFEQNASFLQNRSAPPGCLLQSTTRLEYEGEFIWSSGEQGILFSAMFWGGLLSGFPAGFLADRYGPKNLILIGTGLNILGSLFTPLAARNGGYIAVCAVRFIMGIGQGAVLPCGSAVMARWFPSVEKSTVLAIYTAGNQIASIIAMPLSAWLCQQKQILGGWPAIFYLPGLFSFIFCGLWIFLVTNTPEKNRRISEKERNYILQSLNFNMSNRKAATKHVPWKAMLTSGPLLANFFMNFSASLFAVTLQTYLPTYFKDVLFLNLKSNGFFSALPYICQWITKFIFAIGADSLKKKQPAVNHTRVTKLFNSIGSFGCASILIGISFVTCSTPALGVVLLSLANGMFSGFVCGFLTSLMNIAPHYTGIVNSICKISGQLGAVLSPYLVGWIAVNGTQSEWRIVFLIMAGLMATTGIIFLLLGSAEVQPWGEPITPKPSFAQPLKSKISVVSNVYEESEWPLKKTKRSKKHRKPSKTDNEATNADEPGETIDLKHIRLNKKSPKQKQEQDEPQEQLLPPDSNSDLTLSEVRPKVSFQP